MLRRFDRFVVGVISGMVALTAIRLIDLSFDGVAYLALSLAATSACLAVGEHVFARKEK